MPYPDEEDYIGSTPLNRGVGVDNEGDLLTS